ncbi:glycosidase [Paenarthrobacter sp. Z7-10]|nr:glycosidase [Paenarthrobacter sp. Z7-10]
MRENTNRRLKAVLDIMAAGVWTGQDVGGGAVLAEAIVQVPLNAQESELLSGGIPRGHKNLTAATAKLVKAGWLRKAGGWSITDDGMRAVVAFPDANSLASALDQGTPVPADMPVPTAPIEQPKAAKAATTVKKSRPRKAESAAAPELFELDDVAAAGKPRAASTRSSKKRTTAVAAATAPLDGPSQEPAPAALSVPASDSVPASKTTSSPQPRAQSGAPSDAQPDAHPNAGTDAQPDAVAIAGDFSTLLGAPENWVPSFDEVQMTLDTSDRLWTLTADMPAGYYSYKVAINRGWDENYGAFGVPDGANHELHHAGGSITFRYDHNTRDVSTD